MSMSDESARPSVMKPGEISWAELTTSDVDAAIAYYTGLFGWTTEPFGEDYLMFLQNGTPFAGVVKSPAPDVPTHWKSYVVVADFEAAVVQNESLGGKLCFGPMDVPQVGRIGVVMDPQGAVIGLHQQEVA